MQPVYILFEHAGECKKFLDQVKQIATEVWPINSKQFITHQTTPPKPVTDNLRQQLLYYPYLDADKERLIKQISKTMRHNNVGFDIDDPVELPGDNGTNVDWAEIPQKQGNQTKMRI